MNYTDNQSYCNENTVNNLKKLGYTRRPEDIVADPNKVPLEEARSFLFRNHDAIYHSIHNRHTGKFDYQVTFIGSEKMLTGEGYSLSSEALQGAIDAIIAEVSK